MDTKEKSLVQMLFRVKSVYAPSTTADKAVLIKYISYPPVLSSFSEAQIVLRKWKVNYDQLTDLKVVLPDPSTLVAGLVECTSQLESSDERYKFESLSLRSTLNLKFGPSHANVEKYRQRLLAEIESRVHLKTESGDITVHQARLNDPGTSEENVTKSRFFLGENGCQKGAECTFEHKRLTPRDNRCFNCGSRGHRSHQCKRPKKQNEGTTDGAGASKNDSKSSKATGDQLSDLMKEWKKFKSDIQNSLKKVKIDESKN